MVTLPHRQRQRSAAYPHIEVAAVGMRTGKTTAVNLLAQYFDSLGLPVAVSHEDWPNNPHLKASYADPQRAIRLSQEWFVQRKAEQIARGSQLTSHSIFIQDVPIEGDLAYAVANLEVGRMREDEFACYWQAVKKLGIAELAQPDLLIFLDASDQIYLERVRQSAREFEKADELDYLLAQTRINRQVVTQLFSGSQLLTINTDHLDYSESGSEADRQEFLLLVTKRLRRLGFLVDSLSPDWSAAFATATA